MTEPMTAADEARAYLTLTTKPKTFGRTLVAQLLTEHDAAISRAEKAEADREIDEALADSVIADLRADLAATGERATHMERETYRIADELTTARAWMTDPYNPRHIAQVAQHTTARCDEAVTRMAAERDAVYRERAHLVAALAVEYPSVLVDAVDVEEDGWKIVYITLSTGQCSWHIAPADLDLFAHVNIVGSQDERAQWDQHTTDEKYQRIREQVARTADESYQAWADEGRAATYEHDPDEGKDLDYDERPF